MANTVNPDTAAANIRPFTQENRLKKAQEHLKDQRNNNQVADLTEAGKLTGKMVLGKFEELIKITMATLKNQSPDDPVKGSELAATFNGFSQTLGLVEIKKTLEGFMKMSHTSQLLQAANQLDKLVEVKATHFVRRPGVYDNLVADFPEGTSKASVLITDEQNRLISVINLEEAQPGKRKFVWDGINLDNEQAKAGKYTFRAQAIDKDGEVIKDEDGKDAEVTTSVVGRIEGSTMKNNQAFIGVNGGEYPIDAMMTLMSMPPLQEAVEEFSPPPSPLLIKIKEEIARREAQREYEALL